MKSLNKGLFVILFVVMSSVAVMAAFTQTDGQKAAFTQMDDQKEKGPGEKNPDSGPPERTDNCINIVEGCVTYALGRTIVIDGVTTIKTPLNWVLPEVHDEIWLKYWVNPDGENVACDMKIIGKCD